MFKKAKTLFLMACLIFMSTLTTAVELSRAAQLGIAPGESENNQVVVIGMVAPNSTASSLGIKVGDQLVEINSQKITAFSQIINLLGQMSAGENIQIVVKRDNKIQTLSGPLKPRPYETSEVATVSYEAVKYEGNILRSIVHTPKNIRANEKVPAIFYIQGYTCDSIDYGMSPNSSASLLFNQLVGAGYMVYRVEKPGVGDSQSERDCRDINFTEESNGFIQALRQLKQKQNVDLERIYLWGHSLGVLHSAVVAKNEAVTGIIGFGGVFKPWYDYLLDIYQVQTVKHFGVAQSDADTRTKRVQPFLDLWLNTDLPWQDVLSAKSAQAGIEANILPLNGEQIFDRHFSFFRDMNRYNFASLWHEIKTPVLMIHGSLDIQAIEQNWAFDIAKTNGMKPSKAMILDGAEHGFLRYKTHQQYMAARTNGRYNPGNARELFDPRIGEASIDWLAALDHD
jgi:pimeloyl-ACP methyl ester carboxylesterase